MAGPNETRQKISNVAPEEIPPRLTRSKTSPFNIDRCSFCDGSEFGEKSFYFCYSVVTYRDQLVRLTSGIFMGESIEANNVHEDVCYRKTRKPLAQILIPEVEFHRPPKANESEWLSIKKTRDTTIHLVEKKSSDDSKQMNALFEAALLLRQANNTCTKWVFSVIGHYEVSVSSEVFVYTRW